MPRLPVHAAAENSVLQYLGAIFRFFGWVDDEDMSLLEIRTPKDLDDDVATWAMDNMCYEKHKGVQEGKDL